MESVNEQVVSIVTGEAKQAYDAGDLPTALAAVTRAIDMEPEWPALGQAQMVQAVTVSEMGDFEAADLIWQEFFASQNLDSLPDRWLAAAHHNYSFTLVSLGRYLPALQHTRIAVPILRRIGSPHLVNALQDLVWFACMNGDNDEAERSLEEAEPLCTTDDRRYHQRIARAFLDACVGASGRSDLAAIECSLLADDEAAPRHIRAQACWILADLALARKDRQGATNLRLRMEALAQGDSREARLMHDAAALANAIAGGVGQAG